MAILIKLFAPTGFPPAEYVRFDGVRPPQWQHHSLGRMTIPPDARFKVHVYAYADADARQAEAAPVWDMETAFTAGELGFSVVQEGTGVLAEGPAYELTPYTPEELYEALYGALKGLFEVTGDDNANRAPAPTAPVFPYSENA